MALEIACYFKPVLILKVIWNQLQWRTTYLKVKVQNSMDMDFVLNRWVWWARIWLSLTDPLASIPGIHFHCCDIEEFMDCGGMFPYSVMYHNDGSLVAFDMVFFRKVAPSNTYQDDDALENLLVNSLYWKIPYNQEFFQPFVLPDPYLGTDIIKPMPQCLTTNENYNQSSFVHIFLRENEHEMTCDEIVLDNAIKNLVPPEISSFKWDGLKGRTAKQLSKAWNKNITSSSMASRRSYESCTASDEIGSWYSRMDFARWSMSTE